MGPEQSRIAEHAIDAGGADRDDIGVEHEEGETPIAIQGMGGVEVEDRPLLPGFEPSIARHPSVVPVGLAVSRGPVVELAGRDAEPAHEPAHGDPGAIGPAADEVDDRVARVLGEPRTRSEFPKTFF
jgi:hypothetical protein